MVSPRRSRSMICSSSIACSGGISRVICFPTASSAVYPKIASAPLFHVSITPSSVLLIIASCEDSTIAANCAAA